MKASRRGNRRRNPSKNLRSRAESRREGSAEAAVAAVVRKADRRARNRPVRMRRPILVRLTTPGRPLRKSAWSPRDMTIFPPGKRPSAVY
jgi:hypothetical protein